MVSEDLFDAGAVLAQASRVMSNTMPEIYAKARKLVELGVPLEALPDLVNAYQFTGHAKRDWSYLMRELREEQASR